MVIRLEEYIISGYGYCRRQSLAREVAFRLFAVQGWVIVTVCIE
jgi:hypothetical protein